MKVKIVIDLRPKDLNDKESGFDISKEIIDWLQLDVGWYNQKEEMHAIMNVKSISFDNGDDND